jgi:hypothetical protein
MSTAMESICEMSNWYSRLKVNLTPHILRWITHLGIWTRHASIIIIILLLLLLSREWANGLIVNRYGLDHSPHSLRLAPVTNGNGSRWSNWNLRSTRARCLAAAGQPGCHEGPVGPAPTTMVRNYYNIVITHYKPHKFEHGHLSKSTCTFKYCAETDFIKCWF